MMNDALVVLVAAGDNAIEERKACSVAEDRLPVGIQIVAPRWSELRLLDIARALEEAGILPGFGWPPG